MREKKKNIMRTPEEKESIVLESYQFGGIKTAKKYDIEPRLLRRWKAKYRDYGINGLCSKTGKTSHGGNNLAGLRNKKTKLEKKNLSV